MKGLKKAMYLPEKDRINSEDFTSQISRFSLKIVRTLAIESQCSIPVWTASGREPPRAPYCKDV
jgi:hypothetical protein